MSDNESGKQLNCLICDIEVSLNASYSIFYTVIPHSGTLLANSIQRVIHRNVEQSSLPSTFMCTKCFSLFEELDYSEEKCLKLKKDILGFFRKSCHKNGYSLEEVHGVACQTEQSTVDATEQVIKELKVESCDSIESRDAEDVQSSQDTVSDEEYTPHPGKASKKEEENGKKCVGKPDQNKRKGGLRKKPDEGLDPAGADARRRRRYVHPCRLCGRLFRRPCEVKQHLLSHGGAKPFRCRDCGKRFGSKSGAGIHALKQHGKDETTVEVCDYPGDDDPVEGPDKCDPPPQDEPQDNRSSCASDDNEDDDFEWKMDELKPDSAEEDAASKDKAVESETEVTVKTEAEEEEPPPPEEDSPPSRKVRPRAIQNSPPIIIPLQRNARRRERRARAKKEALPKAPKHKCDICGKLWRTMSEFKSHVATHSDERPYICEICGQAYKHKPALDVHVGMHNGINPFSCPYCNKAFTQKGALQRHLPIHTGEAPYQCELCGKRFVHHTSFNMHTLAHTGQKSYKCKVCGLALLSGSHLKRHSRVHTGERPYQCQTCGKRFAERYNLVAHTRVHDPLGSTASKEGWSKKIHRCQLCGAGFDRKPKLEDHLALSHNKISDTDDSRKWVGHLLSSGEQPPTTPSLQRGYQLQDVKPALSSPHQHGWHHMMFGSKALDGGDLLDPTLESPGAKLVQGPQLLSELTHLPAPRLQPLHIPNNPHPLLTNRINLFSPDNN